MTWLAAIARERASPRLVLGGGVVAALLVFAPHLSNGFVWDDHGVLTTNPAVTGGIGWWEALTAEAWSAHAETLGSRVPYFRPVFVAAMRVLWLAGGGAPWPYHAASLLLHLANGLLGAVLLHALGFSRRAAAAIGAVFLVHPLAGEVVYWASGLGEQLLLLAVLAALLAAIRGRDPAARRRRALQASVAAATACALLTKETGIVVPVLVTLEALRAPRAEWRARLLGTWPAWVPVPAYLVARALLVGGGGLAFAADGVAQRLRGVADILAWDLRRLLWPLPLSPIHQLEALSPGETWLAAAAAAAIATGAVAAIRRRPEALFCFAWALLPLAPPLVPAILSRPLAVPVAERYLFLSLLPWIALLARAVLRVDRRWSGFAAACAIAAVGAGAVSTARYGGAFASNEAHFKRVLSVYPSEPLSLIALGSLELSRGDAAAALALFEAAATAEPRLAQAHLSRGAALERLGRRNEALAAYRAGVRFDPQLVAARLAFADALRDAGRIAEATGHYAEAVRLSPANPRARLDLGTALFLQGDKAGAVAQWNAGLAVAPTSCELLFNVGMARNALRDPGARAPLEAFLARCTTGYAGQRAHARRWLAQ
jgi:tetratricopeptide (TPR) repeat protein